MNLFKIVVSIFFKSFILWFLKKPRKYNYDGFKLIINPGVFHPGLFFSTKYFYTFIKRMDLKNKTALEIGCGSGLLSLLMASKNSHVTAIDITIEAVENTKLNYELNKKLLSNNFKIIQSNLFENLTNTTYDLIIINPPYFFKEPENAEQQAWYCGKDGEYFDSLFFQMPKYIHSTSFIYMILADNCDIIKITSIAQKYNCNFTKVESKKIFWETNYIYQLNY
ncbi:MAG: methyltransferase [Bacteroidota bacterium]|nr:methyltransferase [Bacteroidota bacterium]